MINMEEIKAAIAELEYKESSRSNYILLAALYAIQERNGGDQPKEYRPAMELAYSSAAEPNKAVVDNYGDSEFLEAVSGRDPSKAWIIMDDLMDTMKAVNGKVYRSVMERIKAI